MTRLVSAEWLKLRASRTIRWAVAAALLVVATSLTVNIINASARLNMIRDSRVADAPGAVVDSVYWQAFGVDDSVAAVASDLYTSGQYFGLLMALLFGVYLVGGEFSRRTIVTTLLIEPRRQRVLVAKLITALGGAALLWFLLTVVSVPVGVLFLRTENFGNYLGRPAVWQSILLNAVAFLAWAVLGVGLASLLRHLNAAVVVASLLYLSSFTATEMLLGGGDKSQLSSGFDASILVPSVASHRVIDAAGAGSSAAPWPGALVLVAYGLLAGLVGWWLLRRRDV